MCRNWNQTMWAAVAVTVGLLAVGCDAEKRVAGSMPDAPPTKPAHPPFPIPEFVNGDGEVVGQSYVVTVRNRGGRGMITVDVEWKWSPGADVKPFSHLGMYSAKQSELFDEDEVKVLRFSIPDGFDGKVRVNAKSP